MFDQEIELINDQSEFYQSFRRTSFFERLAHWSRLFCYSFLVLHLCSILLNMLIPFANSAPDLFFQLLFLLLLWGAIEVVGIPLEAIKDTCTIDYQKNWICLEQNRFFFNRVKVLASFNQIKAIGVSSRPGPINNSVFSASDQRYAIFVLDLDNNLFSISDYTLSLDEANNIVQNIHSRHLSGAQIVTGMPEYEVALDPQMGVLTIRLAVRSFSSCLKATVTPVVQAMIAFLGSSIVITAMTVILASVAFSFFNSDIQITRQPIVQLFAQLPPVENVEEILPPPQNPPPEISLTEEPSEISPLNANNETPQVPIKIDLFQQKIVIAPDQAEATAAENIEHANVTASKTQPTPENINGLDPIIFPEVTVKDPMPEDPLYPTVKAKKIAGKPEADVKADPVETTEKHHQEPPVIQESEFFPGPLSTPLNSRIPGENNLLLASLNGNKLNRAADHDVKNLAVSPVTAVSPGTAVSAAVIEPGRGLKNLLFIGQNSADIERILGKPLMQESVGNRKNILYKGFTVSAATGHYATVQSITITSPTHEQLGSLATADNFIVGGNMSDIIAKLGPAEIFAEKPGLHFVSRGISFFPANNDSSRIGSIKIYQPGNRPE